MADGLTPQVDQNTISQIKINDTTYDICDAKSRTALWDTTDGLIQQVNDLKNSVVRKTGLNTAQFAGYVNSGSEAFSFEVLPSDGIWRTASFDFRGKNIIFYKNGSPIGSVHLS